MERKQLAGYGAYPQVLAVAQSGDTGGDDLVAMLGEQIWLPAWSGRWMGRAERRWQQEGLRPLFPLRRDSVWGKGNLPCVFCQFVPGIQGGYGPGVIHCRGCMFQAMGHIHTLV